MPNPPLHINQQSLDQQINPRPFEQIIREHIEEKKKIRPWLKPSVEKLQQWHQGARAAAQGPVNGLG